MSLHGIIERRQNKVKELLVIVDMQNDFVFGALGTREARDILPAVKRKAEEARVSGKRVVFTRDTHGEDYLSTQEGKRLPVLHCLRKTKGWEIVEGLYFQGEKIFDKPSFGSLSLAKFAAEEGYERVEIIGVCTDICVVSNALILKAFLPDAEIVVDAECCAGSTPENHRAALKTMHCCQIVTENFQE